MKNVPVSLSFRCLNSSFYPFVGPIPWLYHTLQRFLLLNTLFLLLSSILPADIDLGKRKGPVLYNQNFHLQTFYGTLSNHDFYSLRSKRFRAVSEQKRGTRVKDRAKNCAIKRAWVSIHFSRSQNRKSWFLGLSLLRNQTETLATHAVISLLIWVVTRHQYGISALVSQTSFRGETSGGITKC